MSRLSHLDDAGKARMVNVGEKAATRRRAVAEGRVRFGEEAWGLLRQNRLAKGDALAVARLAGIQAAKRTDEWIPLCHTVPLSHLDVDFEPDDDGSRLRVRATAEATWTTGVEMEALVAVSAACLALYDMAKAVDRGITIETIRLVEKSGGRSGDWRSRGRGT
jgi:cyclic pyranopterin phosphate synthase